MLQTLRETLVLLTTAWRVLKQGQGRTTHARAPAEPTAATTPHTPTPAYPALPTVSLVFTVMSWSSVDSNYILLLTFWNVSVPNRRVKLNDKKAQSDEPKLSLPKIGSANTAGGGGPKSQRGSRRLGQKAEGDGQSLAGVQEYDPRKPLTVEVQVLKAKQRLPTLDYFYELAT